MQILLFENFALKKLKSFLFFQRDAQSKIFIFNIFSKTNKKIVKLLMKCNDLKKNPYIKESFYKLL